MFAILVFISVVAAVSLVFNAGYILHELGLIPHTKDRSSPTDRKFSFASRFAGNLRATHDFQAMDANTILLRKFGHREIYEFRDPHQALEAVLKRYEERQSRSRYDDLIHLSNYICNHVRCDDKVNELIGRVHRLIQTGPFPENKHV